MTKEINELNFQIIAIKDIALSSNRMILKDCVFKLRKYRTELQVFDINGMCPFDDGFVEKNWHNEELFKQITQFQKVINVPQIYSFTPASSESESDSN